MSSYDQTAATADRELPHVRCGDSVFHRPTGETWLVAYADYESGSLAWSGWPEGVAKLADCELRRRAHYHQHMEHVGEWLGREHRREGGASDHRVAYIERLHGEAWLAWMAPFKPSQVNLLGSFPPFVDTFGHSEAEIAASLIVGACAELGDEWKPLITTEMKKAVIDKDPRPEPFESMYTNPFCRPSFDELVEDGHVEKDDLEKPLVRELDRARLSFTAKGLDRLRRWVRR